MPTDPKSELSVAARSRRLTRAVRPVIEAVERRTMMSAVLANGTLTVTSGVAADPVTVTLVAANLDATPNTPARVDVTVDGRSQSFPATAVSALVVRGANPAAGATAGQAITVTESPYDPSDSGQQYGFSAFYNDTVAVTAGAGNDTVKVLFGNENENVGTVATVSVDAGAGNDTVLYAGDSSATLHGGTGNDDLTDYAGASAYVYGDDGNDALHVGNFVTINGAAHLYGGAGNDTFTLGDIDYSTLISGGDGTDTLDLNIGSFAPRNAVIDLRGPAGTPASANDNLSFLDATTENVNDPNGHYSGEIIGNDSANVIDAPFASPVLGLGGNDRLTFGGGGTFDGGDGNDTLVVAGGAFNDTARLSGGAGTDVVDYGAAATGQIVYLDGSQTSTGGTTFDGTVEQVYGSPFNDVIYGTAGNNALYGEAGNDTLIGNGGADAFFGGDGNDTVYANYAYYQASSYVDGGGGTDTAYTDPTGETVHNVEHVVPSEPAPSTARLPGTTFGPAGSYHTLGNTVAKATDGNLNSFYDAATANGGFVGIDLGSSRVVTLIKYAPRAGYASRMVDGYFQGGTNATFTGQTSAPIYVYVAPASGVLTVANATDTTAFRYWRYVGPAHSNCNVAEVQLFGPVVPPSVAPVRLSATTFGTAGSYRDQGNTIAKATDGNLNTYFDAPTASGAFVALDLGVAKPVVQIKYAPRAGFASRMVGGSFEGANRADFSDYAVVFVVENAPATGTLTTAYPSTASARPTDYRYWRYVGPAGGSCNIAEFQLFG